MEVLPSFALIRPRTVGAVIRARALEPQSSLLAGGTDLIVNMRRGIVAPRLVIDLSDVAELRDLKSTASGLKIGALVTLAELGSDPRLAARFPVLAQAARSVAGPTQRNMGTLGGNLCLDTRCIFYNQSEWWRSANNHCLKTSGAICHVAPKSRNVCFATYSGDLAPALLTLAAEVGLAGPQGRRVLPLQDLFIGYARPDGQGGDGKRYLALLPGEFVTFVRIKHVPDLRSGYDKVRIRRSIEYPVAAVAVALRRQGAKLTDLRIAFTGTNPRPVLLSGTAELCGNMLDQHLLAAVDRLIFDQVMAMKTTFTPGHYRRRVAASLARRLIVSLFNDPEVPQSA